MHAGYSIKLIDKMYKKIILCFVVSWLTCSAAIPQRRSCSNCTEYRFCLAARTLLHKNEPDADAKLQRAFCGIDSVRLPMVCCSELTNEPTDAAAESVESHPNLRLLPDACGGIDGDKIYGGHTAGLYEFPWMVLLSYKTRDDIQFKCGGSLISERYVLTAAHCVVNQRLAGVRVGEIDVETTSDCQGEPPLLVCESHLQDIRIEEEIPHPEFPAKQHDIALLRLKKPVNLTFANAGTVCLPVSDALRSRDIEGLQATVAGWGYTESGYQSSKLLAVEVPVYSKEACAQRTKTHNRFKHSDRTDEDTNKICAGAEGKDSCTGDSGGPLMLKGAYRGAGHRLVEYGIVSYGPMTCGSGEPAVYTDVTKYMKWILDNMRP